MDHRKLMHILLRDMRELEELVTGMRNTGHADPLDIEILRTRISGVRHLLEMAAGYEPVLIAPITIREVSPRAVTPEMTLPDEEPAIQDSSGKRVDPSGLKPEPPEKQPEVPVHKPEQQKTAATEITPPPAEQALQPKPATTTSGIEVNLTGTEVTAPKGEEELLFTGGDQPGEGEYVQGEKHILGEKFTAGQSVHDRLMTEKTKGDLKFSHIPITSLAGAIGTNDRFLFTRELFEGKMELFHETVKKLDLMQDAREAFGYLSERFNWKKSETSLKFVEMVKRRFPQNG